MLTVHYSTDMYHGTRYPATLTKVLSPPTKSDTPECPKL